MRGLMCIASQLCCTRCFTANARCLALVERAVTPHTARTVAPVKEERAQLLAALQCVDYVTVFEERTAEGLLAALQPEVYVKGGDWAIEELPEAKVIAECGIRVEILPQVPSRSTTDIIKTILTRYGGGE